MNMRVALVIFQLFAAASCEEKIPDVPPQLRAKQANEMDATGSMPFNVKLRRVGPVTGSLITGGPLMSEGFYVGEVSVGSPPQVLSVLFDTSSGQVIMPSEKCKSAPCLTRRLYSSRRSASAARVNIDGLPVPAGAKTVDAASIEFAQVDLGDGEVSGTLVRDAVCLAPGFCRNVSIISAVRMPERPFGLMPHDGIIGLGLDALSFSPTCNFLTQVFNVGKGTVPQFEFSLRGDVGAVTFGSSASAQARASPLKWFPVVRPEDGFWQVAIRSVRVGNFTVDFCSQGCRGIVDTGASRLGLPITSAPSIEAMLSAHPAPGGGCQGPDLHFDLEGGALTLRAADYAGADCFSLRTRPLVSLTEDLFKGVFVFGETVLRRYDAAFDWGTRRVGFSLAAPRAVRIGPPVPNAEGRNHVQSPEVSQLMMV